MGTHITILTGIGTLLLSVLPLSAGSVKAAEKPDVNTLSAGVIEIVAANPEARLLQTTLPKGQGFTPEQGYTPPNNGGPDDADASGSR